MAEKKITIEKLADLSNLNNLYQEVRDIRKLLDQVIFRQEFEIVRKRLSRVEKHLGLIK